MNAPKRNELLEQTAARSGRPLVFGRGGQSAAAVQAAAGRTSAPRHVPRPALRLAAQTLVDLRSNAAVTHGV